MRTTIDLSECSPGAYDHGLPHPTIISDDGDIVIGFPDLELRLNYAQFDQLLSGMTKWWNGKASEPGVLSEEEG